MKRPTIHIEGKILPGEQTVVIFNKYNNPPVKRRDIIVVDGQKFRVRRMEFAWSQVTAEVVEHPPVKRRIQVSEPSRTPSERYVVRLDLMHLSEKENK